MNEEFEPHPDYIKGFNEGYILIKHMPELSDKLPASMGNSERGQGFQAGKNQYILEREKQLPSWLKSDRLSSLDKEDQERGKDKNDLDKE
ncbi:hypothetical protein GO495_17645 [Chitinophaga oryziterrae]|uniref:Uncharacterized protein n=1 Tax=Chitinophaga oryziterrae TaxID=1031224 RepID=A0A6N8JD54_9BACT|nr:hypothetical protein [Chitinophaga oryziterrae]MVT42421.1 hypothetical protein [Chitinophaga oryziterrae]